MLSGICNAAMNITDLKFCLEFISHAASSMKIAVTFINYVIF